MADAIEAAARAMREDWGGQYSQPVKSWEDTDEHTRVMWLRHAKAALAAADAARLKDAPEAKMTEAQIKYMVGRFLRWRLPEHFNPDGGISFQSTYGEQGPWGVQKFEPVGTNLFDATQAEAMVRYMIEGMPKDATLITAQAARIETLAGECAKLRELAFTDGLTAPDIAKISGMPMDLLEAAVSSEETTFNPDGDRPLSQLETDNG